MSLTQPPFDASRDFVCATFFRAAGQAWERGAPFDKSLVAVPTLKLFYDNRKITYADASQDEETAALAPATMEVIGGGWYAVGAPWLDEAEKIQGEDKARLRAQQIRDDGEPTEHHGVAIVEGENGWFTVNALWMPEPEKVHGQQAAYDLATTLRNDGPPEGWEPPADAPLGSDTFEASYTFGEGEPVPIADIVAAAQVASGHDVKAWNTIDVETRDSLIKAEIERREADAAKGGGDDGEQTDGGGGSGGAETLSIEDRIAALVDGNTEQQLRDMITTIDQARAAAEPPLEPLGAKSSDTKADLAKLIVEADGDIEAGGDGGAS